MALNNVLRNGLNFTRFIQKRNLIFTSSRLLSNEAPSVKKNEKEVQVTFIKHDGTRLTAKGKVGDSLLDVVVNNHLDLDGYGCCEGTLTCSTCHVVLKQEDYNSLPDKPIGEECDMLELANEVTSTSRLGCQVLLSEKLEGLEVLVPEFTVDLRNQ